MNVSISNGLTVLAYVVIIHFFMMRLQSHRMPLSRNRIDAMPYITLQLQQI